MTFCDALNKYIRIIVNQREHAEIKFTDDLKYSKTIAQITVSCVAFASEFWRFGISIWTKKKRQQCIDIAILRYTMRCELIIHRRKWAWIRTCKIRSEMNKDCILRWFILFVIEFSWRNFDKVMSRRINMLWSYFCHPLWFLFVSFYKNDCAFKTHFNENRVCRQRQSNK